MIRNAPKKRLRKFKIRLDNKWPHHYIRNVAGVATTQIVKEFVMNMKNMFSEAMIDDACKAYGACIGSADCHEAVVDFLAEKYGLIDSEAKALASIAWKEWIEAYE